MIKAPPFISLLNGLSNVLQTAIAGLLPKRPKRSIVEQEVNELIKATFGRYQHQVDNIGLEIYSICKTASSHSIKPEFTPHIDHHKNRNKNQLFDHALSPLPLHFRFLIDNLSKMEASLQDDKSRIIVERYKSKYVGLAFALSQAGLLTLKEAVFFSTPGQIKNLSHPHSCSVSFLPPKAEMTTPLVDLCRKPGP